jgi:hypothetical protein
MILLMKNLLPICLLFGFLIIPITYAQNRAILHFRADGQQELVPLKNNEKIKDVVDRLHMQKEFDKVKRESDHLEWQDTLRYYREEEMQIAFRFDLHLSFIKNLPVLNGDVLLILMEG